MQKYKVGEEADSRLDVYLTSKLPQLTRAYIQKLTQHNMVFVNGIVQRPSYKLKKSDVVTINLVKENPKEVKLKLKILYEDDDCLVINKPAGILSHSKGVFNPEVTVESLIAPLTNGFIGGRAGIVHRLDRATSGVMICAKTPSALKELQLQFSTRKAKKTYFAVVKGHLKPEHAVIDMPIGRNPKNPAKFRVMANGKQAVTEYKVIKSSEHYSLIELKPKTGRTHQLRVHLSQIGHPIVGDDFYKGEKSNNLYLHAGSLELTIPNGKLSKFNVRIPTFFNKLLVNDK